MKSVSGRSKKRENIIYAIICSVIIMVLSYWLGKAELILLSELVALVKKNIKIYLTLINNWRDHTSFKLWLKRPLFCYRGVILMLQNFPTVFWNLWKIWRHTQVRDSRNSRPFTNTCVHSFIHSFIITHSPFHSEFIPLVGLLKIVVICQLISLRC